MKGQLEGAVCLHPRDGGGDQMIQTASQCYILVKHCKAVMQTHKYHKLQITINTVFVKYQ